MHPGVLLPDPCVVAIFGPTGVGKTGVAVELGELLALESQGAVAINCDSMQVYEGIGLLSGAPDAEQLDRLEHRLLAEVPLEDEYSAGEFGRKARAEIDSILDEGRWPILVGGTGLYMRVALTDLPLLPPVPTDVRERIEEEIERSGSTSLHARLPRDVAEWVHPGDRKRVARYAALIEIGQRPAPPSKRGGELWDAPFRRPTASFALVVEDGILERRIDQRVKRMDELGAGGEARAALAREPSRTARKAIGLDEFATGDLQGAARRHLALARRQQTWLRRMEGVEVIDRTHLADAEVAALIVGSLSTVADREA